MADEKQAALARLARQDFELSVESFEINLGSEKVIRGLLAAGLDPNS